MADGLDGTWASLGEPPVEFAWDELGLRATMRTTPVVPYIVAASPGDIDAVAVEPETHAPQAVRRLLGDEAGGLAMLDAGPVAPDGDRPRVRAGRAGLAAPQPAAVTGTASTIGFTTVIRVSIVSTSNGAGSSTMNVWKPTRR